MNIYKKHKVLQAGIGGYKCRCCGNNGDGKNGKKIDRRLIRRRIKQEDRRNLEF